MAGVSDDPAYDHEQAVPIVLLHGMRISGTCWQPLAEVLAHDRHGRARQVRTPDLPGHGRLGDRAFTLEEAVQVTLAALDRPALLVGHSLGGYVAIATAARQPDAVRGLVVIGASSRPGRVGLAAYRAYGRLLAADPARAARFGAASARRMLPPDVYAAWAQGATSDRQAPTVVAEIAAADPLADLARYPGPVWLLNGGYDQFRLGEREFLRHARQGRLCVWPGYNHLSILGATAPLSTFIEDACAVVGAAGTRS